MAGRAVRVVEPGAGLAGGCLGGGICGHGRRLRQAPRRTYLRGRQHGGICGHGRRLRQGPSGRWPSRAGRHPRGIACPPPTTSVIGPITMPRAETPVFIRSTTCCTSPVGHAASCGDVSEGAYQFCTGIRPPARSSGPVGRAERIARRMAGIAVAETFDEVGAAVPVGRPGRIDLEARRPEVERAPDRERGLLSNGNCSACGRFGCATGGKLFRKA